MSLEHVLNNPDIVLTFTGRRWYRIVTRRDQGGFVIEAVGRYAAYPITDEADEHYQEWLHKSFKDDPLFTGRSCTDCNMATVSSLGVPQYFKVSVEISEVIDERRQSVASIHGTGVPSTG